MKLSELTEAREVATKTKTANADTLFSKEFFSPTQAAEKPLAVKQDQAEKIGRAVASADTTNVPAIDTAHAMALADDDDVGLDDSDVQPEPSEPNTLPARTSRDVLDQGVQNPNWLQISQLPGYMQQGIKAMGKTVFSTLTKTKIRDINMMANLQGGGPNEAIEMNAVAHHAREVADHTRDLKMRFGELIPGYEPDAKLYVGHEDTYLVLRDDMGNYIYHWPSKDTKHNEFTSVKKRLK